MSGLEADLEGAASELLVGVGARECCGVDVLDDLVGKLRMSCIGCGIDTRTVFLFTRTSLLAAVALAPPAASFVVATCCRLSLLEPVFCCERCHSIARSSLAIFETVLIDCNSLSIRVTSLPSLAAHIKAVASAGVSDVIIEVSLCKLFSTS